jgi:hypothetical protein
VVDREAVSSASADPSAAKAAETRELTRMATRKITPVSRLSWNITSPTPRKKPWARLATVRPPAPVASSRSSVWTAASGSGTSGASSSVGRMNSNW